MNDRIHSSLVIPEEDAATTALRLMMRHTPARIGLGRSGVSMPTAEILRFGISHARARDAVHLPLDVEALAGDLQASGLPVIRATSRAEDRQAYLARPDLGRQLSEASAAHLREACAPSGIVVVVADGLSSIAVQRHALPVICRLRAALGELWQDAAVVIVEQGRVAVGDEIGEALRARLVVMLIGERPGLSSPDSLGIYMTYAPRRGLADNARNCISNVRPEGLGYDEAVVKLAYLARRALKLGFSGVALKDDSDRLTIED
ncbi:MAG: ethanolamine ammonia-lyase subunit EutC [Comamonadaceae bacterium]|nr:MAG: ethanolamine ammonia-lyase subunit EutC [Comamonadaceae bacterium]